MDVSNYWYYKDPQIDFYDTRRLYQRRSCERCRLRRRIVLISFLEILVFEVAYNTVRNRKVFTRFLQQSRLEAGSRYSERTDL